MIPGPNLINKKDKKNSVFLAEFQIANLQAEPKPQLENFSFFKYWHNEHKKCAENDSWCHSFSLIARLYNFILLRHFSGNQSVDTRG